MTNFFQELMKETFQMNVAVAKSFHVRRSVENRTRLLIIMLETPGVKSSILRLAPQLRSSLKWNSIYITPDLTRKGRLPGKYKRGWQPEGKQER